MKDQLLKLKPAYDSRFTGRFQCVLALLIGVILLGVANPTKAIDPVWEYKVVILQGVTAGGTIEKDAKGFYVDTKRTRDLNALAVDGWEVIAAMGSTGTDHTVYLRRKRRK